MINTKPEYQYQVWDPLGNYIGLIPINSVLSSFNYSQLIGTAFAQTQITVGVSADNTKNPISPILDETNQPLLDETGAIIYDEGGGDIVGDGTIYCEDNQIVITELSSYHVNGKVVFQGYISKVKPTFGADNNIILTCISNGQDMSQYITSTGATNFINQDTDDNSINGAYWSAVFDQAFTPTSAITVTGFNLKLSVSSGSSSFNYALFQGNPALDSLNVVGGLGTYTLGGSNTQITPWYPLTVSNTNPTVINLPIASTALLGNTKYYLAALGTQSQMTNLVIETAKSGDSVAGQLSGFYYAQITVNNSGFSLTSNSAYPALYIDVLGAAGATAINYVNEDVSSILSNIMLNYRNQGGLMLTPAAGYTNTGTITSYAFQSQTVVQAVQIIQNLAPANWYWYGDPATQTVVFSKANTVADITLIKGRHISEIDIESTKENIVNSVFFTGGASDPSGSLAGANIFINVTSSNGYRTGIAQISDNRVSFAGLGSDSAAIAIGTLLAQNYLNQNSSRTYITNVTILAGTMDITIPKLGMMVGFADFGNYVDTLLLQIVGISKTPDQLTMQLGTLPRRDSKVVADIESGLAYQQTVDNPSSPS